MRERWVASAYHRLATDHLAVIAIDTSATRLACARANARIYGVEQNIEFIQADFVEWAKSRSTDASKSQEPIDVVFMSPPWGGIDYRVEEPTSEGSIGTQPAGPYSTYGLSKLAPLHGKALFELARGLTPNVAYYLPRNQDIHEAAALVSETEKVEIEEEWMGSKLKAVCIYYGELAASS